MYLFVYNIVQVEKSQALTYVLNACVGEADLRCSCHYRAIASTTNVDTAHAAFPARCRHVVKVYCRLSDQSTDIKHQPQVSLHQMTAQHFCCYSVVREKTPTPFVLHRAAAR